MKIHVIDSKNQVCTIEGINLDSKVEDLKKILIKKNRITTGNINLIWNAEIMENKDTLEDYNLEDDSTIVYCGEFIAGLKRKKKKNYNIFI